MANRVIQFPVRNAFRPLRPETDGALARDTQMHTHRIVAQVEAELAGKAQRMATGLRLEIIGSTPKPVAAPSLWTRLRTLFSR